jgi:hypothetical protein
MGLRYESQRRNSGSSKRFNLRNGTAARSVELETGNAHGQDPQQVRRFQLRIEGIEFYPRLPCHFHMFSRAK